MSHNACYAMPIAFLDIVLVEDSKPMQAILRSIRSALRARRIRVFDNAADALQAMVREPPNLIVTDVRLAGMSGLSMVRAIRAPRMEPLCFVPVVVVTAHATQHVVEEAMAAGVHLLLAKPIAPSAIVERINWIIADSRRFVMGAEGRYVIDGVSETLAVRRNRAKALRRIAVRDPNRATRQTDGPLVLSAASIEPDASAASGSEAVAAGTPRRSVTAVEI